MTPAILAVRGFAYFNESATAHYRIQYFNTRLHRAYCSPVTSSRWRR